MPCKVNHHLAHADLSPKHLELEVTESTAMLDIQQSVKILSEIKKMGISIAMDDFGIEYSSLNHIKHLPIDTIKIDQSFIRGGLQNPVNRSIVGAVIEIARSLGLRVIAEGVETEEQLRCLQDMKCYGIQGYIFSKPLPPDDFLSILVENRKIN